jgi:cysteine-S-conjugate beta-lyase|tara:strand:- start:675 stop:1817 length:1143 start_codon:yes stop_codon:yes gene_type:complete
MKYNFDTFLDRKKFSSEKWLKFKDPEVIPMWIADMDFSAPPEILEPLRKRIDQATFGYSTVPESLTHTLVERIDKNGWKIDPDWVTWMPGAVVGLNLSCKTFLQPGDMAMTPSPIYQPFTSAPENMERGMVTTVMKDVNGRLELDFDEIENLMSDDVRMFFFCNPHNPGGTVFSKEEILKLIEICEQHKVLICSDEIHCDVILDAKSHLHLGNVNDYAKDNSITLLGPCKTFNLAGLPIAASIIPNPDIREDFRRNMKGIVSHISTMAFVAAEAAYNDAGPWHKELLEYLRVNKRILSEGINSIDGLCLAGPEAGYLAWIDCRETGLISPGDFMIEQAKVGVHKGEWFGNKDYVRLNFGCPKSLVEESVSRLQKAFSQKN